MDLPMLPPDVEARLCDAIATACGRDLPHSRRLSIMGMLNFELDEDDLVTVKFNRNVESDVIPKSGSAAETSNDCSPGGHSRNRENGIPAKHIEPSLDDNLHTFDGDFQPQEQLLTTGYGEHLESHVTQVSKMFIYSWILCHVTYHIHFREV